MTTARQIIGICLVRNEDLYLDRVLANALCLCDRILVADHGSRDRTAEIARAWAARGPWVEHRVIRAPPESHALIESYVNTPTWVLGVDGDEIYDPEGLRRLRVELLAGTYDRFRQLYGNVLHCTHLDLATGKARGHLAPPCRSMTKLYNFAALKEWSGPNPERLHGGRICFNDGYDASSNGMLHEQFAWEVSPFRCLHLVFLRRSSLDEPGRVRLNIAERNNLRGWDRLRFGLRRALGREPDSTYKYDKYRRGPVVDVDVSAFFPEAS